MKWVFVGIISLFLIVFQTVLLPFISSSFYCFDLTIILIVYISLHFSHYLVIAFIAGMGGIMDSLSGAPFFLYTFSYLWIFLIVRLARQLVFQTSIPFVLVVSLLSVTIQQGIFLFSLFARQEYSGTWPLNVSLMLQQIAWGTVLIPLGVGLISAGYQRWQKLIQHIARIRETRRS
jgi:rod shape-determining protein MreD